MDIKQCANLIPEIQGFQNNRYTDPHHAYINKDDSNNREYTNKSQEKQGGEVDSYPPALQETADKTAYTIAAMSTNDIDESNYSFESFPEPVHPGYLYYEEPHSS